YARAPGAAFDARSVHAFPRPSDSVVTSGPAIASSPSVTAAFPRASSSRKRRSSRSAGSLSIKPLVLGAPSRRVGERSRKGVDGGKCCLRRDVRETAILMRMSHDRVEIVRQAVAALNERDVERYLELCTPDVELVSPVAPLEGANTGVEGIRAFFASVEEGANAFRVELERLHKLEDGRVV